MNCIYIALSETQWPPKCFTYCLTLTHSLTHSYTDGGVSHARRHPARLEHLGLGVLLMYTSTLGQVDSGIKPPTFWVVDKLHEPLSHCCSIAKLLEFTEIMRLKNQKLLDCFEV